MRDDIIHRIIDGELPDDDVLAEPPERLEALLKRIHEARARLQDAEILLDVTHATAGMNIPGLTGAQSVKFFAARWLKAKLPRMPIAEPVRIDGCVIELLFRQGPYQVERCIIAPHTEVVDHRHPHIDSIEYFVEGESAFRIETLTVTPKPGNMVRIRPNMLHGATVGHTGVTFLSIQRWIGMDPTHVTDDWTGPTMGEVHQRRIA